VLADPDGGLFGVWEPRGHEGAHVQDPDGAHLVVMKTLGAP
jgi:hypothetical protein